MARINNRNKYPQNDPVSINDYLIGTDSETGFTKTFSVASLLGLGGETPPVGDTAASLSGNIITFPDGQTVVIPVDTDTDTFATINSGVITFANGDIVDLGRIDTDTFATINNNLLTLADGTTYDLTDDMATLAGNVITFPTGQTVTIPNSSTDDQVASEVPVQTNNFNNNLQPTDDTVQKALDRLDDINIAGNKAYSLDIVGNTISLLEDGTIISTETFSSLTSSISNIITGHTIATHTNGAGAQTDIAETVTTLNINANVLEYTREDGNTDTVDLNLYLDDTNLARITSGTLDNNTGIATFTRDDNTTFTLDLSALLGGGGSGDLEFITQSLNSGWRLNNSNLTGKLAIGDRAIDLAESGGGASGLGSFAVGTNAVASGIRAMAIGFASGASGDRATAIGVSTQASNQDSVAMGFQAVASGGNAIAIGEGSDAPASKQIAIGTFNTIQTPLSTLPNSQAPADIGFVVGIGNTPSNRRDGISLKNTGELTAPELTTAIIDAETTGKVLITKDWFNANVSTTPPINRPEQIITLPSPDDSANSVTVEVVDGVLHLKINDFKREAVASTGIFTTPVGYRPRRTYRGYLQSVDPSGTFSRVVNISFTEAGQFNAPNGFPPDTNEVYTLHLELQLGT